MLNLLRDDWRQFFVAVDLGIIREGRINRHGDQLLIAALVIIHQQHTNRAHADNCAGDDWGACYDQGIKWIAVLTERMRDETVIGRVTH